jgi:hypothetical protein
LSFFPDAIILVASVWTVIKLVLDNVYAGEYKSGSILFVIEGMRNLGFAPSLEPKPFG